jgi:ABC-2 type transport system permease protein
MPIYDQGYRRYEARAALRAARFWPITREALKLILAKRLFLLLLAIAWIPFLVRLAQLYIVTRFPEASRILPLDGRLFGQFLNGQVGLTLLLSIFGGAGLVANDLRTGALLVYLSRPLTRRDYVLGKLGVLLALNLSATLLPGLVLYAAALALAPDTFITWGLAWIAPAVVLHALLISLVVGLLALAVSALSRSARVAGIGLFGLVVGLELVRLVLQHAFGRREAMLLSFQADLRSLGAALFGIEDASLAFPWIGPALVLALVAAGCLAVLRARVRAVEIVS